MTDKKMAEEFDHHLKFVMDGLSQALIDPNLHQAEKNAIILKSK